MKLINKSIFFSIPIIFLIGSLLHFVYDWSGNSFFFGFISAINESVWEHTKLAVISIILYFIVYSFLNKDLNRKKWFASMIISLTTSWITICSLFYIAVEGFNIESLVFDIFTFFLAIFFGQVLALHFYKRSTFDIPIIISLIVTLFIILIYMIFTINPPKLPIFEDPKTFSYGIYESVD